MTSEDVSNAVMFARERELLTAVHGGGHSWPGKSVCGDGIMIEFYLDAPRLAMFTHTLGGLAPGRCSGTGQPCGWSNAAI